MVDAVESTALPGQVWPLELATLRLTAIRDNTTEVVLRYTFTGNLGMFFGSRLWNFREYLDHLIDTLAARYEGTGERIMEPGARDERRDKVWSPPESVGEQGRELSDHCENESNRDGKSSSRPYWLPRGKTLEKWKRSYRVILETRERYLEQYYEQGTDDLNPSVDDYREALICMPEWKKKPSASTVRRITRAGEGGWLNESD